MIRGHSGALAAWSSFAPEEHFSFRPPAECSGRYLLGMNDPEPLARLVAADTGLLEGRRLQAVRANPCTCPLVHDAGDAISNRDSAGRWRGASLKQQRGCMR